MITTEELIEQLELLEASKNQLATLLLHLQDPEEGYVVLPVHDAGQVAISPNGEHVVLIDDDGNATAFPIKHLTGLSTAG